MVPAKLSCCALVSSLVMLAWSGRHPALAGGSAVVPFAPGFGPLVVVEVQVNGTGPYPFLVDTGSSHTSIDAGLARQLGAPRVAKTLVSTVAGEQWAAVVRLNLISVGPLAASGILATEVPEGRLDTRGHLVGVIGRDMLAARPFTLDYARRAIEWPDEAAARFDGPCLPLELDGDIWLIQVTAGRRTLRLVPDSGAERMLLIDRGQWPGIHYQTGTVGVASVTNARTARPAVLRELNLGGLTLVNHPVIAVDGADVGRAHADGLLPLHLFDRVTFRPRQGVIQLGPERMADSSAVRLQ